VGRVAAKGLSDELKGTFYAVLETPTGTAYHLPISRQTGEALKVGEIVSFETRAVSEGEREPGALPRRRLAIERLGRNLEEQAKRPGPDWLDRLKESALAHHGFGADLRRAIQTRREIQRTRDRGMER
jgi:hypothetical protein